MDERNRNGEAETEIREAYRREVLKGMEDEILRRTVKKAEVITRSMRPEEKEAYFGSQAFQNALKQTRKKDRTYQAILQDPMPEEWETDYQRLRPLIAEEIRQGHRVELPFLRSVIRSRRPLREARQARKLLTEKAVSAYLAQAAGKIAGDMDREVTSWLTKGNLNDLIRPEETHGSASL